MEKQKQKNKRRKKMEQLIYLKKMKQKMNFKIEKIY